MRAIHHAIWLFCAVSVVSFYGCSKSENLKETLPIVKTPEGIQYGGHLRVGLTTEPTSLDAVLGRGGQDAYYWHQIFDQLVDLNNDLTPRKETSIAENWEINNDPPSITFTLRKGVTFHDGTVVDAEAVKFNIDRILDPKTMATPRASLSVIDSVDVIDKSTVRFNLKRAWGAGLNMLGERGGVLSSPTEVERLGDNYGWQPSGTGPFMVNKVILGTMIHLVRNPNYWAVDEHGNRLPYLDEITLRVILEPTVMTSALRTGEIDLAYLPPKDVSSFQRDPRFNIELMEGGAVAMVLVFNLGKAPLDNVNLRLAVAHAIDSSKINKAIYFDRNKVADAGMWMQGTWAYEPEPAYPAFNLDTAKEYLLKGGKPEGFSFTALTNNSPYNIQTASVIREMLKKINVKMDIEVLHSTPATEMFFHNEMYPMYLTTWSRYAEPDWLGSLAYKSDGYYNAANLERPDIDALVESGAGFYETSKRRETYLKLNEIILREAWFVPLIYSVNHLAGPKQVQNIDRVMGWDGKMNFRYVWLKRE